MMPEPASESGGADRDRLCVSVDVTWFGGRQDDPLSMYESLIGTEVDGRTLWVEAVSLGAARNPVASTDPLAANADANGALFVEALCRHLGRLSQGGARRVVVGLDAPILTTQRGLPPRARTGVAGATQHRSSDLALGARVREHGKPWSRAVNVLPGAPVPARIEHIVSELVHRHGFVVWDGVTPPRAAPDRVLVEIFPAASVWAAGVRGAYGDQPPEWAQLYKRVGTHDLEVASSDAVAWAKRSLAGVGAVLVDRPVDGWAEQIAKWAAAPATTKPGVVRTGKRYDDVVESGIAFLSARAWADGNAHVFRSDDGDGHIIVPGPLPDVVRATRTTPRGGASSSPAAGKGRGPEAWPIDGCTHVFQRPPAGWDAHIENLARHPAWHPEVADHAERKRLFREEFAEWLAPRKK